jgi:hypothetical protein
LYVVIGRQSAQRIVAAHASHHDIALSRIGGALVTTGPVVALMALGSAVAGYARDRPILAQESSSMSDKSVRDLFDRWERVWHQGRLDLSPDARERPTSVMTNRARGA